MKNKKKIWIVCVGLVFLVGLMSCNGQVEEDEVDKKVTIIGAPLALTGKGTYYGTQSKKAIDLALEDVNSEDKQFKLKMIYEDTQGDPKVAVNVVNKLITSDGVKILLGPTRSASIMAVAPVTESKQVILFSSVAGSADITDAGDYVFRNRETGKLHGLKAAEFLIGKVKRVAVLAAQVINSLTYKRAFMDKFKELGGEVVYSTEYDVGVRDFRTLIVRAKDNEAQAFYLAVTTGEDASILVRQIKELGFEGLIVGSAAFNDQAFLDGADEASEGVIITAPAFDVEDVDIKDYVEKFKLRYGEDSSFFAANAYDAVEILVLAIEVCGGDEDTNCIRDYLYGVKDYPGVGGLTSFDENGDVVKPIELKMVKDGKFVKYE